MTIWTHEITCGEMMNLAELESPETDTPEPIYRDMDDAVDVFVCAWRYYRNETVFKRPYQRLNIIMRPMPFDESAIII